MAALSFTFAIRYPVLTGSLAPLNRRFGSIIREERQTFMRELARQIRKDAPTRPGGRRRLSRSVRYRSIASRRGYVASRLTVSAFYASFTNQGRRAYGNRGWFRGELVDKDAYIRAARPLIARTEARINQRLNLALVVFFAVYNPFGN